MDIYDQSLKLHEDAHGKLGIYSKVKPDNRDILSMVYTPGVAAPCRAIAKNRDDLYRYTMKSNTVAVVTNGTAVLGLGNIGAAAALPVMEGKCLLFKKFAGIDAFPLCVETEDVFEFVNIVKKISIPFAGINLEDIAAPACFEIERRLINELDIPVFHDDQHGTAIVTLAALINALKVTDRAVSEVKIVISGAGAAADSIINLLGAYGVEHIVVCDRKGVISKNREDISLNKHKLLIAESTNPDNVTGSLADALRGSDVFIGVSGPGIVNKEMVESMAKNPIVFAMANPDPEILPEEAKAGGAAVIGTGRSDYPNQINNVLAFPGVFRGAIDGRIRYITKEMKLSAAVALARCVKHPTADRIIPDIFDEGVSSAVTQAVLNSN